MTNRVPKQSKFVRAQTSTGLQIYSKTNMKTNTIPTAVAVLGATVALNLSVLAGPGPQSQSQARNVSAQKSVAAPSSKAAKAPSIAFGGTKSNVSESHEIP